MYSIPSLYVSGKGNTFLYPASGSKDEELWPDVYTCDENEAKAHWLPKSDWPEYEIVPLVKPANQDYVLARKFILFSCTCYSPSYISISYVNYFFTF